MTRASKTKGILALVSSAFGFAVMAACVRLADEVGSPISSFQKSFFRNFVALVLALLVFSRLAFSNTARARAQLPRTPRAWLILLLRSVIGTCGIFANFYALGHISIADGQTLNKTAPFFTVVCAWIFLGERASRRQVAVLLLAFLGIVFVAKPGFAGAAACPLAIGTLGGFSAGAAYACVRALRQHAVGAAFIVLFFSMFSCLASIPFMVIHFDPMTGWQIIVLIAAGVGAALGQFGVTLAYGYAAPCEIAVYDYSNILFTAAFGFLLFGQLPDGWSILGFILILLAAFCLHHRGRGT